MKTWRRFGNEWLRTGNRSFCLPKRRFSFGRYLMQAYKRVATMLEPVPLEHFEEIKRMLIARYGKDLQVSIDGDYLVFLANFTNVETVEFGKD